MSFWIANQQFAVSASIIVLGYVFKRTGILREGAGEVLAKVVLNFTLPAVILLNVPSVPLRGPNVLLPFFSLTASVLMVLIGLVIYRGQERTDRGLSLTASAGHNISLFAIPVAGAIYGSAGVARLALIDVGNAVAILGMGYYIAFRNSPIRGEHNPGIGGTLKMLASSIPFVAYIIAIVMNLAGIRVDGFLRQILEIPAAMNRGAALLVLGILLRFSFPAGTWRAILPPLLVRYLFGIGVAALVLFVVPLPVDLRVAVAGALIMPVGMTIIPFAVQWGYDRDNAAAILNTGIPISFVLFWAVWALGEYLPALQP